MKMRVKNIDENDITRGDMICNNLNYCQESSEFKAIVSILELPEEKKLLSSGYECVIHLHAISTQVEVSKVEAKIDKATGKKTVATFLKGGERGICVLKVLFYLFRWKDLSAFRNTTSCQVWGGLPFATRASNY